jgi:mannose-6-phosphate isomerase-like protein (cupin superfamily)
MGEGKSLFNTCNMEIVEMKKHRLKKFNLNEISEQLLEAWSPMDVEIVNGSVIRIAKFDGDYHWHKHKDEDELFLVFRGKIKIMTESRDVNLVQGEGVKIPKGIEHRPVSLEPSIVIMFEPSKIKSKGD